MRKIFTTDENQSKGWKTNPAEVTEVAEWVAE